ncbi:hypothetical protein L1987_42925 [Smallanthus sonchifolius]|uniref:Uncharacterized protein n=1 Tax=Smallanthus sonchifolius TaxID=185202 RepID=A0ACB9GM80_9ASTR|nr:hypothetical protein L1987_42925 [Smallanthus sonchifolius]
MSFDHKKRENITVINHLKPQFTFAAVQTLQLNSLFRVSTFNLNLILDLNRVVSLCTCYITTNLRTNFLRMP